MAYVVNQTDEEKNQQQNNTVPTGAGGGIIQPQTQVQGSNTQQAGQPSQSGSFTNLQSYVNANQGQGGQLAGQITGKVTDLSNQAHAAGEQAQQQYQGDVNAQVPSYDQGLIDQISSRNLTQPNGQGSSQFHISDLSPEQMAQLKANQTAQYQGPKSIEETNYLQPAMNLGKQAKDAAQNASTETGRQQFLRNNLGGPNYTQGQQYLDQALLQMDPSSKVQLEGIENAANPTLDYLGGLSQPSQDYATQAQGNISAHQKSIQDALTHNQSGEMAALQSLISQKTSGDTAQQKAIQDQIAQMTNRNDPNFQQAYAQLLGVPYNSQDKFNLNMFPGIKPGNYAPTLNPYSMADVASDKDVNDLKALYSLTGQPQENIPGLLGAKGSHPDIAFNRKGLYSDAQKMASDFFTNGSQIGTMGNYVRYDPNSIYTGNPAYNGYRLENPQGQFLSVPDMVRLEDMMTQEGQRATAAGLNGAPIHPFDMNGIRQMGERGQGAYPQEFKNAQETMVKDYSNLMDWKQKLSDPNYFTPPEDQVGRVSPTADFHGLPITNEFLDNYANQNGGARPRYVPVDEQQNPFRPVIR